MRAQAIKPPNTTTTTALKTIQPTLFIRNPPENYLPLLYQTGYNVVKMFLVILTLLVLVVLVIVAAIRPTYSIYSIAELTRRAKHTVMFKRELKRQEQLPDVQTLLQVVTSIFLLTTILLSVVTFGWGTGVAFSILVILLYPVLARIKLFSRTGDALYGALEPSLLKFVDKFQSLFEFLRSEPLYDPEQYRRFDSREELTELIANAEEALSDEERTLMTMALLFRDKTVGSIMTPRTVIDHIKKSEFLGPLVLDELSALGHSRLPVIDGDLNKVVGILHLRDLLSLDIKRSVTAEKAMEPKVYYIHQEDSLEHALSAFLRTRHHLFIVINDQRETVGLLTLEDVIETLIGRKIVDEDDIHEDLRAVAKREGKANNSASGHVDL